MHALPTHAVTIHNSGVASALAHRLSAADYTLDAVTDRLGEAAVAALARNTTIAARDALGDADDPQATLIRTFLLQDDVPGERLADAVGDLASLVETGLIEEVGPRGGNEATKRVDGRTGGEEAAGTGGAGGRPWSPVRASVEIRPYASAGLDGTMVAPGGGAGPGGAFDGWVVHDRIPTLDGRIAASRPDFVLGLSPASTTLAQLTVRRPVGRALDLGTGCGVQSLHLAGHSDRVVATDLNPRAVALARWTAALNGLDVDVREGSLYEPVAGESFDLIVTNPPYVMSPPTGERLVYREGVLPGDELVRQVVVGGAERLAEGGMLQVLGNWAITGDESWQDRLTDWIAPTGCDALVLERERLDPYAYIEVWLADEGLVGTPEYASRYAAWVDYFRALGITEVGMGWIALYRSGSDVPDVRCESWPHAVVQPVGEAFANHPAALAASKIPDAALEAAHLSVDPRLDQETIGRPGAEDPEHVVLRQRYGFGRAVEVDTALAAIVGACDGELPVGVLIDAVADVLDADPQALRTDLFPRLRTLIREGYFVVS